MKTRVIKEESADSGVKVADAPEKAPHARPRPPLFGALHPLEREARRNLSLAARLGKRLSYQLREVEEIEVNLGKNPGSVELPDGWLNTMRAYSDIVIKLMRENREHLVLKHGKGGVAKLDAESESAELIDAVTLLTDEELKTAMRKRGAKDGAP